MKADALSLSATLNSAEVDVYTIPQYQRPYTWETQNFEVLWEDLTDAYKEFLLARSQNRLPGYFFLGPVVFVKANQSYDIIDGQQRITTLHILLWYLYRKLKDDTERKRIHYILTFLESDTKLKVSSKDASTFLQIRETDDQVVGTSKMAECANYFRRKINVLDNPEGFSAFLRDHTQFIVIVADDYAKAWDLFIGLNGKGVPLNPTDLVKAFVCGRSDVGETAGVIWEDKILPLKEDSTSYLLFLTRFKSHKFISENNLFREITSSFPTLISTFDISKYSDVFHWFWQVPIDEIPNKFLGGLIFSVDAKKSLRILRDIGRRDFTTLLFQYSEAFGIRSVFDENFLKLLASFQIRMALSRKRSRERKFVSWFNEVKFISDPIDNDTRTAEQKLQDDKVNALNFISQTLRSDAPDDSTFETLVQIASYQGNYPARLVLRHYEEGERGNRIISDFQLEHLMPQTGTDFWYTQAGVVDDKQ
jgi:hypothetical protein